MNNPAPAFSDRDDLFYQALSRGNKQERSKPGLLTLLTVPHKSDDPLRQPSPDKPAFRIFM